MREKILFDDGWLFHRGDINIKLPADKGPIYCQSKTECMVWGPASRHYNSIPDDFNTENDHEICTDLWEPVTLPHDYIIEQVPDKNENNTLGYFRYENAWYRKKFYLSKEDEGKRITLLFEGIAVDSYIYLNGCILKRNFCGYNSFEVDITDFIKTGNKPEDENVLAVYVKTSRHEGWWYEGGGIYRHVWLNKTNTLAVDLWGVYALPRKESDGSWATDIETTIINSGDEEAYAEAETAFYDMQGHELFTERGSILIPPRDKGTVKYSALVKDPVLWDIDAPYLYEVVTRIYKDGIQTDEYRTRTGFRDIKLDPEKGLFLNGKHVKIKGVCGHQDCGLTGKAVADNVQKYKIGMLKEMGANGYRTSHYPQSESIMDALDEMGFLVMDETRWFSSSDDALEQLRMLVKRDRNRPSVIMWSVGNEEPLHIKPEGRKIVKSMIAEVRRLDSRRHITTAVSNSPREGTVYDDVDVIGINYNLDAFDEIHERYSDKPIFSSECCATGTTRGWYEADSPERSFYNACDKDTTAWFLGREKTWKFLCEREWMLGGYQWIGFEHRGETVWPRLSSQSGAIDLYLQKKDAFYQNRSLWTEDIPMVHLMPHWNWQGREGEEIRVCAYTNCDELELYLNGKSLGRKKIEKYGHGEWIAEYQPGELKAVGYRNGETVCEDVKQTTGQATRLALKLENEVTANGRDVAIVTCYCTDDEGREVPNATCFVEFFTNGLGNIAATGSDITDHTPPQQPQRRMRAGRITAAVKVGKEHGALKIYASAQNMRDAVLTVTI